MSEWKGVGETMIPERVRVKLEWDDVLSGEPSSPHSCPIALALRNRGFDAAVDKKVAYFTFVVGGRKREVVYELSERAKEFVVEFDSVADSSFLSPSEEEKMEAWLESPPTFVLTRASRRAG